jgi:DNA repair protein RecN (Recombination protein N)
VLEEAGLPADDELILRRTNSPDGRKTAFVNDRRTSGEVLRSLADTLVELHGQHDDRGLLDPRGHRRLLDDFADSAGALAATRTAWAWRREAAKALGKAEVALEAVRAEEEFLRHAVAELDKLDPKPGEEAKLDARRRLMQGASRIKDEIARAHAALGADGAEGLLLDTVRRLEAASDKAEGRLDAALDALSRTLTDLGEAEREVAGVLEALDFNPSELEAAEERLFAIRALARKHGVLADDLGTFAGDLRGRLEALDRGAENIGALREGGGLVHGDGSDTGRGLYQGHCDAVTLSKICVTTTTVPGRAARLIAFEMQDSTLVLLG